MRPKPKIGTGPEQSTSRPFPWHCPKCRRKEVRLAVIPYRCERMHQGHLVTVEVLQLSVPRCAHCGELVFNYGAEDQISQALLDLTPQPGPDRNDPKADYPLGNSSSSRCP